MVPSSPFTIVLLVYLVFTCFLGGLCGAITSLALRLRWNATVFVQDMAMAGMTCSLAAITITKFYWDRLTPIERGYEHGNPWLLVFTGAITPLVRHLMRFVFLSKSRTKSR